LESKTPVFPSIGLAPPAAGKSRRKISKPWKNHGRVFQALENRGATNQLFLLCAHFSSD
jgi:hypothetical protein